MSPLSSPLLTTSPGTVSLSLGGVAGNVSGAASSLLDSSETKEVLLVAPVGDDSFGDVARRGLRERGMRDDGLIVGGVGEKTATCGILLDPKGELVGGVADMDITSNMTGGQVIEKIQQHQPAVVAFDGNLSSDAMGQILAHCETQNIKTFFEPTSNAKALSLLKGIEKHLPTPSPDPLVTFSTPNIHELSTFYSHTSSSETPLYEHGFWFDSINISGDLLASRLPPWVTAEGVAQMAANLLPVIRTIFVKSGSRGVLVVQRVSGEEQVAAWNTPAVRGKKGTVVAASTHLKDEAVVLRYYPALKLEESEVGSVTGAGDNLAGAILAALVRGVDPAFPEGLDIIVDLAQRAAVATLKSTEAVGDHAELRPLLPASKN